MLAEAVARIQRAVRYLDHMMGPDADDVISESVRFSLNAIKASLVGSDAEYDVPSISESREENAELAWLESSLPDDPAPYTPPTPTQGDK